MSPVPTRFLLVTLQGCCLSCRIFGTRFERELQMALLTQKVQPIWCADPQTSTNHKVRERARVAPTQQVVVVAASVDSAKNVLAYLRDLTADWLLGHVITVDFARPGRGKSRVSTADVGFDRVGNFAGQSDRASYNWVWRLCFPPRIGRCLKGPCTAKMTG